MPDRLYLDSLDDDLNITVQDYTVTLEEGMGWTWLTLTLTEWDALVAIVEKRRRK